jgi:ATP-dependent RNA helicase DeaD
MTQEQNVTFKDLSLIQPVLKSLEEVGYEIPTPIQARTIPLVLEGRDVLGQAQTGTGKTAAFALPLLSRIDLSRREVQVLVLAPTRELAIQVAEAFQRYAAHMKGFHVLPIYGGQAYDGQLRSLKRGVHVVVGTPGRVMDHMRRKTLRLNNLQCLVLDEADEMLRMGFIDDVEWILQQTPPERQTALFSATMPDQIRRIAGKYLRNPEHIAIETRTTAAETVRQRYRMVSGMGNKLDALTRILEAEIFDGVLVFVRTRIATTELAEKLEARGYASAGLSGDMAQKRREQTVSQLKKGKLDILVATDVAARGLDINRISHVINFDIPYDVEAYIHRIGRTGRAGRSGEAILFVAPRERRLLYAIERATQKKIEQMELPSTETINDQRIARFKQNITDVLGTEDLGAFRMILEQYRQEHNVSAIDIAAALAKIMQGDDPLLLAADVDHHGRRGRRNEAQATRSEERPSRKPDYSREMNEPEKRPARQPDYSRETNEPEKRPARQPDYSRETNEPEKRPARKPDYSRETNEPEKRPSRKPDYTRETSKPREMGKPEKRPRKPDYSEEMNGSGKRPPRTRDNGQEAGDAGERPRSEKPGSPAIGTERFRVEVGSVHGAKPGNLVGAIANEALLDGNHIGRIEIYEEHSTIDLPVGMPKDLFHLLKKVQVCGQRLQLARLDGGAEAGEGKKRGGGKKHGGKKGSKSGGAKPKKHRKGSKPRVE